MEAVALTFVVACILFAFYRGVHIVGDWLGYGMSVLQDPEAPPLGDQPSAEGGGQRTKGKVS